MKVFVIRFMLFLLPMASLMSCKKCYECSKETTVLSKGEEVPASADVQDVCGKKNRKSVESEGFTCVKVDKK